jgi:hypothetical protein
MRNSKFYSSSSRTNLQLDKKCIADLVPFSHVFSEKKSQKKLSFSPAMPQPKKRKYRNAMVAIHK